MRRSTSPIVSKTLTNRANQSSSVFDDDDELWTRDKAAAFLEVRPATLEYWAVTGGGPRFYKLNRAVRYRKSEVVTWALSQPRGGQAG